jgi:hypothetical protein
LKVFKEIQYKKNYAATGHNSDPNWQNFGPAIYAEIQKGAGDSYENREFFAAKDRHAQLDVLAKNQQIISGLNESMIAVIDGISYDIIEVWTVQEAGQQEVKLKLVK